MGHDWSVREQRPEVWRKWIEKPREDVRSGLHLDEQLVMKAIGFPRSKIVSFRNIWCKECNFSSRSMERNHVHLTIFFLFLFGGACHMCVSQVSLIFQLGRAQLVATRQITHTPHKYHHHIMRVWRLAWTQFELVHEIASVTWIAYFFYAFIVFHMCWVLQVKHALEWANFLNTYQRGAGVIMLFR